MIRIYYLIMTLIFLTPAIMLLIDVLRLAGILDTPDPGLAKRMRPF